MPPPTVHSQTPPQRMWAGFNLQASQRYICHSRDGYALYRERGDVGARNGPTPSGGGSYIGGAGTEPSAQRLPEWGPATSGVTHPPEFGVDTGPWHGPIGHDTIPTAIPSVFPLYQTRNRKHRTDDIMSGALPSNGLMMSTKESHVTIYYK